MSQVSWFRDYGAKRGRKDDSGPCELPDWQREPLCITFRPAGKDAVSYDFVPGSAMLVEDSGDDADTPAASSDAKAQ